MQFVYSYGPMVIWPALAIWVSQIVYRRGLVRGMLAAVAVFFAVVTLYLGGMILMDMVAKRYPSLEWVEMGWFNLHIAYALGTPVIYYLPVLVVGFAVALWLRHRRRVGV